MGVVLAEVFFDQDVTLLMAALCVAAPWIQATGRLRCLVQGRCHGSKTQENMGIHYRHARSRVCQIAHLGGQALHPTPLYSIIGNILIGLVLLRLLLIGAPWSAIAGSYLILSSLARFVEEAYRGEPQTPVFGTLNLCQWVSVAIFALGSVLTMLQSAPPDMQNSGLTMSLVSGSIALGLLVTIAMGVDWPKSNRRFSRLT
ncbi:prolipoprotein diacylglyceryl transferase family protein [Aliiroseovarius sp. PrR006]|uniref:prolipoprotein diacylglyceryl transferase family protein n=1 Tax=Aliiroseovarius sp. PrR006 TaxID=2706883 RepID=UPI0013D08985|nr:prolipoprotein diacylglyceryl transferase [Aliiroseovarius sp. PrR006]